MPEFHFVSFLRGDVLRNVRIYLSQFITVDQRECAMNARMAY